jgi:hypothetical protein
MVAWLEIKNGLLGVELTSLPLVPQMVFTYLYSISKLIVIRLVHIGKISISFHLLDWTLKENGKTIVNLVT